MKRSPKWSSRVIWIIIIISLVINIINTRKIRPDKVIDWDIKSYYAYLPAAFIHGDLTLEFLKENDKKYSQWFWPSKLENGNKLIITSMGLSMLYSPFFMLGHTVASVSKYEANGYSHPYAFGLIYSILFYVIIGFIFLRKILKKYFDELTTSITLLIVYFGTNLLYYSLYIPMTHAYNFALYSVFIYYTIKWHNKPIYRYAIILGLIYGLLSLVRPTNALAILIFVFYNTISFSQIKDKFLLFIKKWKQILIIALMTFLIWIPQMLYWKEITGQYLFFSYGVENASFYWDNPQLFNILLSFRKGWLVYTPVMLFAIAGIWFLMKKPKEYLLPIILFLTLFIYIQSSWWSWWFGGGYGNRAFIDIYALLAIPLAALIQYFIQKSKLLKFAIITFAGFFIILNCWNIMKYNHVSVHYYWNSRISYFENLFHLKPANRYWRTIPYPDYDKAREGIYVAKNLIERYNGEYNISPQMILNQIKSDISSDNKKVNSLIINHAISIDSATDLVARNIYELNYSLKKYIEPIENKLKENFNKTYKEVFSSIKTKHGIDPEQIVVDVSYPNTSKYVYTRKNFTSELISSFYKKKLIDTMQDGKLYEIVTPKDYCVITDDMENKKHKTMPITCNQKYSISLPGRVFENCFSGDWATNVGHSIHRSIRITLYDLKQNTILLTFWKKGNSKVSFNGNSTNNGEIFMNESRVLGHWRKQEILVKLNSNSTQPIQINIQSNDNKNFIADDLIIYIPTI